MFKRYPLVIIFLINAQFVFQCAFFFLFLLLNKFHSTFSIFFFSL
jgi:hypothetical protein